MEENTVVFQSEYYILGLEDGLAYIIVKGNKYKLTCHPYEPCLYITDKDGRMTAVHNSFDPLYVMDPFGKGQPVTSITGLEYDAKDFCRMIEYALGTVDIQIDEAERRAFAGRSEQRKPESEKKAENAEKIKLSRPDQDLIIKDDPFYDVIDEYPDSVIDYCLVANGHREAPGFNSHWSALVSAAFKTFVEDNGETVFHYTVGKARAKQIDIETLFAPSGENGKLSYRKAFLEPPFTNSYSAADFDKINDVLFPRGKRDLEVYEWTTDWSEYFDDGHEWWGALCLTVYDKALDRFAVIMASATD
ncbi:MAG: hypothetical protein IJS94_07855 [Clostridia bacterium]|nr:hypothetical protein [Clostridia bacterium]